MREKNNIQELMQQVAAGNEAAFRQLVAEYSETVFFHAMTFLKSWPQAEEVVQDVFVKIWESRQKLATVENWDKYLFIVSRNLIISVWRYNLAQKRHLSNLPPWTEDNLLYENSPYDLKEFHLLLNKALQGLSEQKRTIFTLIHLQGLSQRETGHLMGITEHSVRWNLVSALHHIRDYLAKHGGRDLLACFYLLVYYSKK